MCMLYIGTAHHVYVVYIGTVGHVFVVCTGIASCVNRSCCLY